MNVFSIKLLSATQSTWKYHLLKCENVRVCITFTISCRHGPWCRCREGICAVYILRNEGVFPDTFPQNCINFSIWTARRGAVMRGLRAGGKFASEWRCSAPVSTRVSQFWHWNHDGQEMSELPISSPPSSMQIDLETMWLNTYLNKYFWKNDVLSCETTRRHF